MTKPRVCIGISQPELTDYRFTNCLWNLMLENAADIEISRTNAVGSLISKNRCLVTDAAKAWGATHLLQIDAVLVIDIPYLIRFSFFFLIDQILQ